MKRRDCLTGLAAALLGAPFILTGTTRAQESEELRLRILSFNIQIGRGPGGSYSDPSQAFLDRTGKAIAATEPDIAGLQEVDNKTNRSGKDVDQLGVLAGITGMIPTFTGKKELPGGIYGIGVLSKEKPLRVESAIMVGSVHPRALQMIEFEKYWFFNTHLPLTAPLRMKGGELIDNEARKRADKPIILVGDLNAEPDSPEIAKLRAGWKQVSPDAPTFPSPEPKNQIDYVFVRLPEGMTCEAESRVVEDPSTSDHRPVFCELVVKRSPAPAATEQKDDKTVR